MERADTTSCQRQNNTSAFFSLRWVDGPETVLSDYIHLMNFKLIFRGLVILLLLLVVLYIGMNNTHSVDFNFPVLPGKKISQPAALVFFAIFAAGVIAGLLLRGGEKQDEKPAASKKK
jgi:uncharacterized integral membrane protein